ncbi:MAG: cupin domain-containing protein [Chloroflexota bacterium]|nr:cupin domain-containing protein [Chloroflexota bacterium]
MVPSTVTKAQIFNLTTPYLQQGITSEERAHTELLSVLIKVYARGGENRMHAHMREDHSFIVLEGEATFHLDSDEHVRVLKPYEGVMLPRGTHYRFESSGEGNLVMLRVGAAPPGSPKHAVYPDGSQKTRDAEPYGRLERIEMPGRQFGQTPRP